MSNRILLADGSSTLLGANGTDHILLVAGVVHGFVLLVDGTSALLLANGVAHLLLQQEGHSFSSPTNPDRIVTISAESRGLLISAESRTLTIAAE